MITSTVPFGPLTVMESVSPGIARNNRRVKLTIPDSLIRHAKRIAKTKGIPLSKYLSSLIIDTITDEESFLKQERERLASALVAVEAKTKMKKLRSESLFQRMRDMIE